MLCEPEKGYQSKLGAEGEEMGGASGGEGRKGWGGLRNESPRNKGEQGLFGNVSNYIIELKGARRGGGEVFKGLNWRSK